MDTSEEKIKLVKQLMDNAVDSMWKQFDQIDLQVFNSYTTSNKLEGLSNLIPPDGKTVIKGITHSTEPFWRNKTGVEQWLNPVEEEVNDVDFS